MQHRLWRKTDVEMQLVMDVPVQFSPKLAFSILSGCFGPHGRDHVILSTCSCMCRLSGSAERKPEEEVATQPLSVRTRWLIGSPEKKWKMAQDQRSRSTAAWTEEDAEGSGLCLRSVEFSRSTKGSNYNCFVQTF